MVKAILQDVDSHLGSASPSDDMTVVAMGIDERRARRRTSTIPNGVPVEGLPSTPAPEDRTSPGVVPPERAGERGGGWGRRG